MSNLSKIIRGDDVVINCTLHDENREVITNLNTATSIFFRIKNLMNQQVVEFAYPDHIEITDNDTGKIAVTLSATETLALDIGIHKFEIEVVDADAKKISMRDSTGDIFRVVVTENF